MKPKQQGGLTAEYEICQKRGHEPDILKGTVSTASYGALAWATCKYCGSEYTQRTVTEILERNTPVETIPNNNGSGGDKAPLSNREKEK